MTSQAIPGAPNAGFAAFALGADMLAAISAAGFENPTTIQSLAIPAILSGGDVIARARTGTGKTAAYALPCLDRLVSGGGTQLLILAPTRELTIQIANEMVRLSSTLKLRVAVAFGGEPAIRQLPALRRGAEVVVATPGRLLDYLTSNALPNFAPKTLVLDEADEMLAMGFVDEVRTIASHLPKPRRTLLFSATMPASVTKLSRELTTDAKHVVDESKDAIPTRIEQRFYVVNEHERLEALIRLIEVEEPEKAIVFCRTRKDAGDLAMALSREGIAARALHGELDLSERREVTEMLRSGKLTTLVATDVAARGLDIAGLSHVFNYGLPMDVEVYVHRIGRTGRAGAAGIALTLVHPADCQKLQRISGVFGTTLTPSEIPTRAAIREKASRRLFDEISATVPTDAARALAARLLAGAEDADEVFAKLATLALNKTSGDDPQLAASEDRRLGFSMREIDRWQSRTNVRPPFKRRFPDQRGEGRRDQRGGGGQHQRRG